MVGDVVDLACARAAARLGAHACLDALHRHLPAAYVVDRLLKITGFIAATADFTAHGEVLDAASEVFRTEMGTNGTPARSAIGVSSLPHGACIEIEMVVAVREEGTRG